MVEFSLLLPWYVFLFIGAIDYGFYSYSLIATQNAARIAAMYCSGSSTAAIDSDTAWSYAADQLRKMPNVGSSLSTNAAPLVVTANAVTGPDGGNATSVTVTYTTPQMIPIPGLLTGQLTISRTVQMKLRS
jgi:hypothetical protein